METKLIRIGNSKGVRIPNQLLLGFDENTEFDIKKEGDRLILSPSKKSREHWVDQMKKELPETEEFILNEFDENEWEW